MLVLTISVNRHISEYYLKWHIKPKWNIAWRSFYCKPTLLWHDFSSHTQRAASRWIKACRCETKVILSSITALSSIPKHFINRQPNRALLHLRTVLCFTVQSHWVFVRGLLKIITHRVGDNTCMLQLCYWLSMGQVWLFLNPNFQTLYLRGGHCSSFKWMFLFLSCRLSHSVWPALHQIIRLKVCEQRGELLSSNCPPVETVCTAPMRLSVPVKPLCPKCFLLLNTVTTTTVSCIVVAEDTSVPQRRREYSHCF